MSVQVSAAAHAERLAVEHVVSTVVEEVVTQEDGQEVLLAVRVSRRLLAVAS
jgi:hypothetical protein